MLYISSYNRLKRVIHRHVEAQVPLCIWGHGAIGKSMVVQQVAKEFALEKGWDPLKDKPFLADVRLAGYDPADLQGLPDRSSAGEFRRTRFLPPDTMPIGRGAEEFFFDYGILFMDELNRAETPVINAVFSLLTDRRIGHHELLPGWSIVIAGNPSRGYDVNTLDYALLTRMSHVVFTPEHPEATNEWVDWALHEGIEASYVLFLAQHPDKLWGGEHEENDWEQLLGFKAEPSPRGHAYAGKLLRVARTKEEKIDLITAAVGAEVAAAYEAFSPRYTIDHILRGEELPEDISRVELLGLEAPLALVKPTVANARKVNAFLKRVAGLYGELACGPTKEIAVAMMKALVRKNSKWASLFDAEIRELIRQI